jgi:hypothetical protein
MKGCPLGVYNYFFIGVGANEGKPGKLLTPLAW